MKTITKYALIGATVSALASSYITGSIVRDVMQGKLEEQAEDAKAKIQFTEHRRDNFRRMLIQHGNPEGWELTGDGFGNPYYTRSDGDGLGGCWTEHLSYQ